MLRPEAYSHATAPNNYGLWKGGILLYLFPGEGLDVEAMQRPQPAAPNNYGLWKAGILLYLFPGEGLNVEPRGHSQQHLITTDSGKLVFCSTCSLVRV